MSTFRLACLAYVCIALPGSTLGLIWPAVRLDLHEPVEALGILLITGTVASVAASVTAGRLLSRVPPGRVLALGTALPAVAMGVEVAAPSLWAFAGGTVIFGLGFGALDAALNAYAASRFGARRITWMHASYGLGAIAGPLLVTALSSNGVSWRWTYVIMALAQAGVAAVFVATRHAWVQPATGAYRPPLPARRPTLATGAVVGSLAFAAVAIGIESGAGTWGYVFLTDGRGLVPAAAGAVVSGYWATMFVGRMVFGVVAERAGPSRVLTGAVAGVTVGAMLAAVPGPAWTAAAGVVLIGLAAAPIFPLFILTMAPRVGGADAAPVVSLQVAASAVGSAVLPSAMGLAVGAYGPRAVPLSLLVLCVAMCGLYAKHLPVDQGQKHVL